MPKIKTSAAFAKSAPTQAVQDTAQAALLSHKVQVRPLPPASLSPAQKRPISAQRRGGLWLDLMVMTLAMAAMIVPMANGAGAFYRSVEVDAPRGVLVAPQAAPTQWPGQAEVQSTRSIAPDWVAVAMAAADTPRRATVALAEPLLALQLQAQPPLSPYVLAVGINSEESPVTEVGDIPRAGSVRVASVGNLSPLSPLAPMRTNMPISRPNGLLDRSLAGMGMSLSSQETPVITPAQGMRPRIAIVLTAAGLKPDATMAALSLPAPGATLAIAPIAADAGRWASDARAMGRGALVEMPMEPSNYPVMNPGELTLLTSSTPAENLARAQQSLTMVPAAQGISVYLGAKFVTDAQALAPLAEQWGARKLMMFEPQPIPNSRMSAAAAQAGAIYLSADVVVDRIATPEAMQAAFARLEQLARTRGRAVGVGVTQMGTIGALHSWMQGLSDRGIQLVPLDQIATPVGVATR